MQGIRVIAIGTISASVSNNTFANTRVKIVIVSYFIGSLTRAKQRLESFWRRWSVIIVLHHFLLLLLLQLIRPAITNFC